MSQTLQRLLWGVAIMGALIRADASEDNTNGRGRHKKIHAVPVPGAVTVDGSLDDWDLSGRIEMYVIKETSDMQSAKFALMYDAKALYLGAEVRDPSPMMNRHDPEVDAHKGWDADSCQFRIVVDAAAGYPVSESAFNYRGKNQVKDTRDDIAQLILWYFTDKQEANMQMHLGMGYRVPRPEWAPHGLVPKNLFEGKYVLAEDKRGYTFEYRIPWATLGATAPLKGGDLVAGTVQFNWSRPDGLKTAGGAAWAYDVMGGPGFAFQRTDCWGKIIFSEDGDLPKDLVEEGVPPEKPMPLKFAYDLPEDSECTVQLFDKAGRNVRILVAQGERKAGRNVELWDGLDDQGNPVAPGEYAWKGVYHEPLKTKFLFSAHNSGQPPYHTDNNKGGWGGDHGTPTSVCPAAKHMLLTWDSCESGWGIIKVDLAGRKVWGSKHNATAIATDGKRYFTYGGQGFHQAPGIKVFDLRDARLINWGNGSPLLFLPDEPDEQSRTAATGLAYADGVVYAAYAERNTVALYDAVSGNYMTNWTVEAPGRLAVRSDGSLLAVSPTGILVVNGGTSAVLIPSAGDHRRSPIADPTGLAVAADGTIYVANAGALQNISVFDATGTFVRTIGKPGGRPALGRYERGGIYMPGGIALDADGRLWVAETTDSPKRHSVWDVKTGTCVDEFFGGSSYFGWAWMDPAHPDELYCHNVLWKVDLDTNSCEPYSTVWRATAPNMVHAMTPGGYSGHPRVVTAPDGGQFRFGMWAHNPVVAVRVGDVFKPFLHSFPKGAYPATADMETTHQGGNMLWQDRNDDQTIQAGECIPSPSPRRENMLNWLDAELNLWCDGGHVYRPTGSGPDGRPVYDLANPEKIPFSGNNANCASLWPDRDGNFYTLNPGVADGLSSWDKDWNLRWRYSPILRWNKALNLPIVKAGRLWGLTMPLGVAGNFTGASTYFNPYHIFTLDGIYVGMVMRDGRSGGLGPDVTASETLTGQLVRPKGMDRYFLIAGAQDGRVTEILGLDTVKYLEGGTYTHAAEAAQIARQTLEDYQKAVAKSQILTIVRGKAALASAPAIRKGLDAKRGFEAKAAYDADNLYVEFEVTSPFDLVNAASGIATVFKGGNLLDIQIATDPAADPENTTPVPGDVRILVTRDAKKQPVAVLYRPKVADFAGTPTVLRSPTGTESFDAIDKVDDVTLTYRPRRLGGGFTATVTIPNTLIGLSPKPGDRVRMDLGYIFGNKPGTQAAARLYWYNTGFSAGVTNDIPNESRLEPHEWGTATVE